MEPRETIAFAAPYEQDGVSVLAASANRTHTATRIGDGAQRSGFDAEMSGSRPMGAYVVRDGRVRWHPAVDWTRVITTAEVMVGGVLAVRPAERGWRRRRPAAVARRRPWWARLLAATTLESLVG